MGGDVKTAAVDPFGEEEEEVTDDMKETDDKDREEERVEGGEKEEGRGEGGRPRYSSGESGGSSVGEEEGGGEVTLADLDISVLQGEGGRAAPGRRQTFYFYQSSDGQAIFLHALNVQMLVSEFGSLENCPSTIRAEILEKENCSMTGELRDRLRYLKHLPLAQAFEVSFGLKKNHYPGISNF